MKKLILFFMAAICSLCGYSQEVSVVQPKIMVIPYTKQGEDLRTIIEDDVNQRIAMTKIREAFDQRGFTTIDFVAKLKAASQSQIFTSENQSDLKSQLVQMSGADIYVEAEMNVTPSSSGNSVKMLISAYDCSTGGSLANKVGDSGKFYTDDYGKLASKAIEQVVEDFLNTTQEKFTDMVENGRSLSITFGFAEESNYSMASEVGEDALPLSDNIELWMEENAYKNNYHIQGTTDKQMIFDDVRIPIIDPKNGNNYNANKFGLEIYKFMRKLGLQIGRDIKGTTIYITVK